MNYVDPCLKTDDEKVHESAEELGWKTRGFNSKKIKASEWGELKKKLQKHRESNEFICVSTDSKELDRKASDDPRIDILFSEEMDETVAEQAEQNSIAVGLKFRNFLNTDKKDKVEQLSNWRKIIRVCDRKNTEYVVTTAATDRYELRSPESLKAFINSIEGDGESAVNTASEILEKNREKIGEET